MKKELLLFCFLFCFSYRVFSQTTYYVKIDGNDGNAGTSWNQSFVTVQKAIAVASNGDKIFVKKGNYPLSATIAMKEGVKIYGSFEGWEASLSQRTINLPVANDPNVASVLNGQNALRVITNDTTLTRNVTASAVLDGFVIKAGDGYSYFGGGIYNNNNSPTLANITITGNIARSQYGAGAGGGIYNNNCNPTLNNVTISGNTAGDGGGIFNKNSSPTLTNVTISGNTSTGQGGGIYNSNSSPILTNVTITENTSGGSGGGVKNGNDGIPIFNNVIISNNTAGFGGGVSNLSCHAIFNNVTISGNSATSGGGMINESSSPLLTNVMINGNSAGFGPGGMGNYYYGNPILTNVIITGNRSGAVGGIYNYYYSDPVLLNTIVLGNTGNEVNGISNNNSTPDIKFSLVQGMNVDDINHNLDGNSITADQVFLNPVAAGSAPTTAGNYRLLPCSPAINAGTTPSPAVPTDMAGNNRVGAYDLGVYEFQGLGINELTVTADQQGTGPVIYSTCSAVLATVASAATGGASGRTITKVWIETTQPAQYVKRHYQITPATDGAGKVTLYFSQAEFNDFNTINTTHLPTGPDDATGKANLIIEKRKGQSTDGTGVPDTYAGAVSVIDPADTEVIWNSSLSRWEVSFDVIDFSGFFVKSNSNALPVTLTAFEVKKYENTTLISWKTTAEVNSDYFDIERSSDGKNWETIGIIAAMNNSQSTQSYSFTDMAPRSGENLYRLKILDMDNSYAYSRLRSITFEVPNETVLYPNPSYGPVQVHVSPRYINSKASLIDASGKVLRSFTVATENFLLNINLSGVYLLRMNDGKTVKVVVGQ